MHGMTVRNIHLDQVLKPVVYHLDQCWWYLGGTGMSFPQIRPPKRQPPEMKPPPKRGPGRHRAPSISRLGQPDPADWERYSAERDAAVREYSTWLVEDRVAYRVGKPGFFSRYAAGMDGDWAMYYASDAPDLQPASFDEVVSRFDRVWFDAPPGDLPADIGLITRDVDAAYLDLFFRDEWVFQTVWNYADVQGMKPTPYRPYDVEPKLGRRKR